MTLAILRALSEAGVRIAPVFLSGLREKKRIPSALPPLWPVFSQREPAWKAPRFSMIARVAPEWLSV